jgi:hypothetical protein
VIVAIMAWWLPRKPHEPIEGNVPIDEAEPARQDVVRPVESDSKRPLGPGAERPAEPIVNQPSVAETNIPFLSGLFIREYEPGQRLSIRENKSIDFPLSSMLGQLFLQ